MKEILGFSKKSAPAKSLKYFCAVILIEVHEAHCAPSHTGCNSLGGTWISSSDFERKNFSSGLGVWQLLCFPLFSLGFLLSIYQFCKTYNSVAKSSFGWLNANQFQLLGETVGLNGTT